MKYFLFKFEFFSGFYESVFLKQICAENEKEALVRIISFFNETDEENSEKFISETLGKNWTTAKFWKKMYMKFMSSDDTVGYELIGMKEIDLDLDRDF